MDGDGQLAVFLGATAICVFDAGDRDAERVCIATLSRAGLGFDVEIGEAFGVHRNTAGRLARQLDEQGMAGVVAAKRGPKGPHKVTGEVEAVTSEEPRNKSRGSRSAPRDFVQWRIRVLLDAGKPDWAKLPTVTP